MAHRTLALLVIALGFLVGASSLDRTIAGLPDGTSASIALVDLETGRTVAAHRADQPARLASVTKLFVSAAALLAWDPDHTLHTRVYATGDMVEGVLPGLLIVGGGSPCLDEHFTDGDPERIFRDWIAQLTAAGVRRIDGPVLVDGSLFSGPERPTTYPQDHHNLQQWYSAPSSAFAWLDNCIEVQVRPGSAVGDPGLVLVRPTSSRIGITNRTTTVARIAKPRLLVSRSPSRNHIIASGRYAAATAWFPLSIEVDADLLHADHFSHLLRQAGIEAPEYSQRGLLTEHADARLLIDHVDRIGPAIDILNRRSQNFYGEQILRLLGVHRGHGGSVTGGIRAIDDLLRTAGLDTADLTILDGSGLSYDNRASAATVCRLLTLMHGHDHGPAFRTSLRETTLGGSAVAFKTGTLAVARSMAGFVDIDDRPHAFAVLIERPGRGRWPGGSRAVCDPLVTALIASAR